MGMRGRGTGGWICREGWQDSDADIIYEGMRIGQRMLH